MVIQEKEILLFLYGQLLHSGATLLGLAKSIYHYFPYVIASCPDPGRPYQGNRTGDNNKLDVVLIYLFSSF